MGKIKTTLIKIFGSKTPDEKTPPKPTSLSVASVVSDTLKQINQDAYAIRSIAEKGVTLIAIADGVGSAAKPDEGSRFVANKAVELLETVIRESQPLDYPKLFATLQQELDSMVTRKYGQTAGILADNALATTLIIGVDTPDTFTVAYVGNGCAYYIPSDFIDFPDSYPMPWNVVNLLSPHSSLNSKTGRDEMFKFFGLRADQNQSEPTVVTVWKDQKKGEVFIIATDGLASADHVRFARRPGSNDLWMLSSEKVSMLCKDLRNCIKAKHVIADNLQEMLLDFIQTLKENELMDDDITIGIVVSPKALEYCGQQ